MSKKPSTAAIGAFVVGAIMLAVAALISFGSGKLFKETKQFVLFFEGSVQGLSKGAPVAFKGVRVGSVTDIKVLLDSQDLSLQIPVFIEIEPNRLTEMHGLRLDEVREKTQGWTIVEYMVEKGLRAHLDMQSLVTGQLFVNLDFFPNKSPRYVNIETGYTEIPTVPSSFELISKTVEELPISALASKANKVLRGIERWVNSPEMEDIMVSLSQTAKEVRGTMEQVNSRTDPVLSKLEATLGEAYGLLHEVRSHVSPLVTDIRDLIKGTREMVNDVNGHVGKVALGLDPVLKTAQSATKKADAALLSLEEMVSEESGVRYEFQNTLKELSAAARSIRTLADYLERHPEALLHGKGGYGGKAK